MPRRDGYEPLVSDALEVRRDGSLVYVNDTTADDYAVIDVDTELSALLAWLAREFPEEYAKHAALKAPEPAQPAATREPGDIIDDIAALAEKHDIIFTAVHLKARYKKDVAARLAFNWQAPQEAR